MVTVLCFSAIMIVASENGSASERKVKNVIIMIPDGCSSTHTTLARWYSGESLALDQMPSGLVRTYTGESIITDSAPAATAFARGRGIVRFTLGKSSWSASRSVSSFQETTAPSPTR